MISLLNQTAPEVLGRAALPLFGLEKNSVVTLHNTSENLTFRVVTPEGQNFALRLHRPGYQQRRAIESELAWVVAVRLDTSILAPRPVRGADQQFIQTIVDPSTHEQHFAVMFHWEVGAEPLIDQDLFSTFEILGARAAQLHAHAKSWQRPEWFTRQTWNFETSIGSEKPLWGHWRDGQGMTPDLQKLFARTTEHIGTRLKNYGQANAQFGLIHGDLRLANLLIDGDDVKVIDFDDCGFGWFMSDAATPVSFHEHEPQVPELIEAWKTGYRSIAPLAKVDEAEIPTFVMMRRLVLVAWLSSRPDTPLSSSLGAGYTHGTAVLAEDYLLRN
jgi:Ser/Thr protein kinase RdoA (MazF antagonist)